METSNNKSTAFSIEAKAIFTQSDEILDLPLVPKSKSDLKTKEEKQQRVTTLAEDTRRRLKRSAMDIYYIGLNLLEAQNIIEHGQFLPWLRQEFGMSKTSAYEFIHVAEAFESKFPIIGNLINSIAPTALYKLAAPSTPEAARDEAINLVKTGEVVDPGVAKNLIKKYKTPKTVKTKQQKVSSVIGQSNIDEVDELILANTNVSQIEKKTSSSISLSSRFEQDELQKLIPERDTCKAQLEALQIANDQLQLDIAKLRSELTSLQIIKRI
ncbi:DUF3102 domain-containing protein [Nostoc sp.]|uniref:DUF3102 domain-containing protein n=1 Tax=Nostoc sp. TaxID=1180 RepID=UPI002FF900E8